MIEISALNVVLGLLVPFLVALGTKKTSSSAVKAYSNAGLSAVTGGIAAIATSGADADISVIIFGIFATFVTSITSYYGLFKPTGAAPTVQDRTATFGI